MDQPVTFRLDRPRREGKSFRCEFQILGPDAREYQFYAVGEDSMQALVLAIEQLYLHLALRRREGRVTWSGEEDLGLFPRDLSAEPATPPPEATKRRRIR